MSGIVGDSVGKDVAEEEQVLNVIRFLLDTEYWQSFSLVMVHNEYMKTFEATSKHLKMEDDHYKLLALPVWHLLPRATSLGVKDLFVASRIRKVHTPLKTPDQKWYCQEVKG